MALELTNRNGIRLDLFQYRLTLRPISGGPLPSLMQQNFSIGLYLRCGAAAAGHEHSPLVDLMIAHVDGAMLVDRSQEMPLHDLAALVVCKDDLSFLPIVEECSRGCLGIVRLRPRAKVPVLIVDHSVSHFVGQDTFSGVTLARPDLLPWSG